MPLQNIKTSLLSLTFLLTFASIAASETGTTCERLTALTYTQATAPSDVSAILSLIHSKINADVTNVVGIDVQWSGTEIHRRVGERLVRSSVTRLKDDGGQDDAERMQITQCFEVPFTILDVDECQVTSGEWAHKCKEPSVCVNTLGSYECVCPLLDGGGLGESLNDDGVASADFWNAIQQQPRSPWEKSLYSSAESSCPDRASTYQCCEEDGHSKEGSFCRSSFKCPVDPCNSVQANNCAVNAKCHRSSSPLSHPPYSCKCPTGTLGNGRKCPKNETPRPKVKYDGVTPTEETEILLSKEAICGCSVPVVDGCSGYKCSGKHEACVISTDKTPTCACKQGYVRDSRYGCIDEHPPVLHIRPYPGHTDDRDASVTRLSQGDRYEEHGVDIIDDNAEEYFRSLRISYSKPLPQGCLLEIGQFDVNYTVATPWTTPDYARAKRTVIIGNVNECLVKKDAGVGKSCPELVAMCDIDAGATCIDVMGSYSCKCPEGTEGDGFLPIARLKPNGKGGFVGSLVPLNYRGGTGCRDTSRPVIEILGPNPKKFRVATVAGLKGDFKTRDDDRATSTKIESLLAERRSYYENEIKFAIRASSGAELCATTSNPNVRPTDCIRATDHTYKGVVDLTPKVSIGEPTPKDGFPLQWRVPYYVIDDAGNKAQTVWRDITIEEVDLQEFEQRTRAAIMIEKKEEVDREVKRALAQERRKNSRYDATENHKSNDCPKCEDCKLYAAAKEGGGSLSASDCDSICERKVAAALASARGVIDSTTCAATTDDTLLKSLSCHFWIPSALDWTEKLIGLDALIMLMVGCFFPIVLYVSWRVFNVIFFSTAPEARTYYHSIEDEEKEKLMAQNVTYYRSPSSSTERVSQTPGSISSSHTPLRPPTASLSSQRNGIFLPQESQFNGNTPQQHQSHAQQYTSLYRAEDDTDSIYQAKSPITPSRNIPSTSTRSYNLRRHQ
eukprot:CCRYP_004765-RB/>CCRYP_004765-RB protein AED:0.06 eAED:0.06 QI:568/1/1/1/0.66/0.5/4/954/956